MAEWSQGHAGLLVLLPLLLLLLISFVIFLAPAIPAIITAAYYNDDTSPCNDGTDYTVDLQIFLYVGGGVQLGLGAIWSLKTSYEYVTFEHSIANNLLHSEVEAADASCQCSWQKAGTGGIVLFWLTWIIIGFIMYVNQMSEDCQDAPIGKMILAWCIHPLALCGTLCCGMCCAIVFQENIKGAIQICFGLIMFAPAIAAIITAAYYNDDTSPCNDGTDYTVDLQTFLYVGGGVFVTEAVAVYTPWQKAGNGGVGLLGLSWIYRIYYVC
eukprot:514117_1